MCAVNHKWTEWSEWGVCNAECGPSKKTRTRFCIDGKHGGTKCPMKNEESYEKCEKDVINLIFYRLIFFGILGTAGNRIS